MEEKDLIKKIQQVKTNAQLFEVLENNPPQSWIKTHPILKEYKFLPIDKVEYLLRTIFGFNYKIEIISFQETFNSITVAVRVHYRELESPYNWYYYDGIGSEEPEKIILQEAKTDILDNYAMAKATPSAKTLAIKDACDHFGRLFGCDLNRKDTIAPKPKKETTDKKLETIKTLYAELKPKIKQPDRDHIERIIEDKESIDYDKIITELTNLKNKK